MPANPWELYESKSGWEQVSSRLDAATEKALAELDATIASVGPKKATTAAFLAVLGEMERKENVHFGASDSEPREHLSFLIEKRLRAKGFKYARVDRWGDVSGVV